MKQFLPTRVGRRATTSLRVCLVAGVVAVAVSGCGEIQNTIVPPASAFDTLTVLMPTNPNANYAGIYEAQQLGYFRQAALTVHYVYPTSSSTDTLTPLFDEDGDIAISEEPSLFLARNKGEALVSVAAIRNEPLTTVVEVHHKSSTQDTGGKSITGTSTSRTATSATDPEKAHVKPTYKTVPDNSLLPSSLAHRNDLPTYDGLTVIVRKPTIVQNGQLIRRFVQAVARGYAAVESDPVAAVKTLITVDPTLAHSRALQLKQVENAIPSFTPDDGHPWGWQNATEWNRFGTWLYHQKLLTNPNAITDASTNELLAGQGV